MTASELRSVAFETRDLMRAMKDELDPAAAGQVVVSGMLAEQLARQLSAGADPGAVTVGDASQLAGAAAVVHVIAGEPSSADESRVRTADRAGVPVVLVQLWPQEDWTPPFVLSPFVIECRAGEGFPLEEIAGRLAEAAEHAPALASRIPALRDAVTRSVVRGATLRAALLGAAASRKGASRPVLALEQARLLARLRTMETPGATSEELPALVGVAAAAVAASFALREVARTARGFLPAPLANVAVAAATTWALGEALRRWGQVLHSDTPV